MQKIINIILLLEDITNSFFFTKKINSRKVEKKLVRVTFWEVYLLQ